MKWIYVSAPKTRQAEAPKTHTPCDAQNNIAQWQRSPSLMNPISHRIFIINEMALSFSPEDTTSGSPQNTDFLCGAIKVSLSGNAPQVL